MHPPDLFQYIYTSSLHFADRILEKVVGIRFWSYLNDNNLHGPYKSIKLLGILWNLFDIDFFAYIFFFDKKIHTKCFSA